MKFTFKEELLEFIGYHQRACIGLGCHSGLEEHDEVLESRMNLIEFCLKTRQTACDEVVAHFEAYTNAQSGKILADQVKEILKVE